MTRNSGRATRALMAWLRSMVSLATPATASMAMMRRISCRVWMRSETFVAIQALPCVLLSWRMMLPQMVRISASSKPLARPR